MYIVMSQEVITLRNDVERLEQEQRYIICPESVNVTHLISLVSIKLNNVMKTSLHNFLCMTSKSFRLNYCYVVQIHVHVAD